MNLDFLNPILLFPALILFSVAYYLIPARYRWTILLAVSIAFLYWVGSWSIIILFLNILLNFVVGLQINRQQSSSRKAWLIAGIVVNLLFLFGFKYFSSLLGLAGWFERWFGGQAASILFPVGLSFYTLQSISYLVDLYKGLIPVEKHLGIFALYQAFFPKIISGPVERGKKLLPQLHNPEKFNLENIYGGATLLLVGLFKKVVVADHLLPFVNEIFEEPGTYQGVTLVVGLIFLGFQIFADFSGYTDIALGIAQLLGIRLTPNFKRPYLSDNLVEFWNRWHLSFSTWLRDYIFYPLRRFWLHKNSSGVAALILPPLITMLASGIWHGTGWTFVVWGLYHALFYTLVIVFRNRKRDASAKPGLFKRIMAILVNFGVLTFGWLIFRSESLHSAWVIFKNIFVKSTTLEAILRQIGRVDYLISVISILLILSIEILIEVRGERFNFAKWPALARWSVYLAILLAITLFGVYQKGAGTFIYGSF